MIVKKCNLKNKVSWYRSIFLDDYNVVEQWNERWIEERSIEERSIKERWIEERSIEKQWIEERWIEGRWIKGRWIKERWIEERWIEERWIRERWNERWNEWWNERWIEWWNEERWNKRWTKERWNEELYQYEWILQLSKSLYNAVALYLLQHLHLVCARLSNTDIMIIFLVRCFKPCNKSCFLPPLLSFYSSRAAKLN